MICVVVLQNCMCFVEGGTGSCSETCVTCGGAGSEEVINVEVAIDIKDEIPEAAMFPPIKTEHEVSLWDVCAVVAALAFTPFFATEEIVKLHLIIVCCASYFLSIWHLKCELKF